MQEMDLDTCVDFNQLLEVLYLCDRYLVPELLEECVSFVSDQINLENCVQVCEASFNLVRSKDTLLEAGLVCLTRLMLINVSLIMYDTKISGFSYSVFFL